MRRNFTVELNYEGQIYTAVLLPSLRHNGMHYEVNIKGYPRFLMRMSELGRYDITTQDVTVPYGLVLAASDAIEAHERRI